MNKVRRKPSLNVLLSRYAFSIDYDTKHKVILEETDILLSANGLLNKSSYLYLIRPAEFDKDWVIYSMLDKTTGYLPSSFTRKDINIKALVKSVKALIS